MLFLVEHYCDKEFKKPEINMADTRNMSTDNIGNCVDRDLQGNGATTIHRLTRDHQDKALWCSRGCGTTHTFPESWCALLELDVVTRPEMTNDKRDDY